MIHALDGLQAGPVVGADLADLGGAETDGLAAVHGLHPGPGCGGQRGLPGQQQLAVEHDAGRASGQARRCGVEADAPLHPDGRGQAGDEPLEEDERALLADPPACLVAFGDDGVDARRLRDLLDGCACANPGLNLLGTQHA